MEGDKNNQESPGESAAQSVFLSYASQDADTANWVCQFLENRGVSCWMAPRDVKPGAQYADAIVAAINEASAVVLVLSGSAVASSHVGKEVERASSKRKSIIAFRIDAAALNRSLEYFLSESQWIDVPALGMPAALAKLAEAVGQRRPRRRDQVSGGCGFPWKEKAQAHCSRRGGRAWQWALRPSRASYFLAHKTPRPAPHRGAMRQIDRGAAVCRYEREEGPGVFRGWDVRGDPRPVDEDSRSYGDRANLVV